MNGVVAILTDFGSGSNYVGVMKGVLLRTFPGCKIVDLFNDVKPQSIREGAWILSTSCTYFPQSTTFLCVVDPGVGSSRSAIAIRAGNGNVFVGPDNGLMWDAVLRSSADGGDISAVRLSTEHAKSSTFHGRDVFSPAAARVASGANLSELGTPVDPAALTKMSFISECPDNSTSVGEVVTVDSFGNIITSAPASLDRLGSPDTVLQVVIDGECMGEMAFWRTYADAEEQKLFVIEGSCSSLEVSVKNGDASKMLPHVSLGKKVEFHIKDKYTI